MRGHEKNRYLSVHFKGGNLQFLKRNLGVRDDKGLTQINQRVRMLETASREEIRNHRI